MAIAYGDADQVIVISPQGLSSSAPAAQASDVIENIGFSDVLIFGTSATSGAPSVDKAVWIYAYATVGGTTYPDTVTGADATISLTNPTQLSRLGIIRVPAVTTVYKAGPWSLRACFGGTMPSFWGIVVVNRTGQNLTATAGNHAFTYQGVGEV